MEDDFKILTKREKVVVTAIQLFVANGFDKVSTADISKTCGVATGTMFHHFSSKDDIIVTCYRTAKRNFIAQTITNTTASDVKQHLQFMWYSLIEWSLINQDQFQYMQQFVNSPYYSKQIMEQDDTWLELQQWWKTAIDDKKFKDIPVEFLIKMFSNLLYSTITFLIYNPKEKNEYLKHSFSMCWDMVAI